MTAPTLTTARLVLRPHEMADFDGFRAVMASPRAVHMGGPFDTLRAWGLFASDVAQWALIGWGGLAVTRRDTGDVVGQVAISQPPHFPELELGWLAYDGHEGRGYLAEAAQAFRAFAFGRGLATLVSYVDPENVRSIRLAERLGARRDDAAARPDPQDLVFRHAPEHAPEEGAPS